MPVLILVLVDLGGKDLLILNHTSSKRCLNPCFGGFGWESISFECFQPPDGCLNPCFGGFGWERTVQHQELIKGHRS